MGQRTGVFAQLGNLLVAGLIVAACNSVPNSAPPPAAKPVADVVSPTDPQGSPNPQGAPFLQSRLFKFRVPTGTDIQVAVEGWILRQQNTPASCDDGCFRVISLSNDGNGQSTYLIQAWPPAYQRRAHQLKFEITDVSLNSSFTGEQKASKPLTLIILEAINPALGGPPSPAAIPGTPEWAANNETDTLAYRTIGLSSAADATAYYTAIGANAKPTLTVWKSANGFDSGDDATAIYFNGGDLGFGRSMHMKKKANGDVAYYVSNYPTVDDAARGTNLIATVAMEYSPGPNGGPRFTKFYVYFNDDKLVPSADLDGNGQKFVPNLCVICHGVSKYTAGGTTDLGARFLPFDLASFQFGVAPLQRNQQEDEFKKLNLGILQTNANSAQSDLMNAWYRDPNQPAPNTLSPSQDSDAVPDNDWKNHLDLYSKVVRVSCRTCHIAQNAGLDFASFAGFQSRASGAQTQVCSFRDMPNAKVTYQKFWLQHLAGNLNQVGVLNQSAITGWNSATPCPQ